MTEYADGSIIQPKISVLIPVYNVAPYVERCLRSLFANTIIKDCEVIIIDDCSTDDSASVVRRILNEFSALENVSLRSHDCNRGSAAARNTALLQAHGKYIICVDSDDWVEPNYLEELYTAAERENADITGCDLYSEFSNRTQIKEQKIEASGKDCIHSMFLTKTNGWLWLKLIRKALIDAHSISWLDGVNILEDLIFSTKCFYYAQKTAWVNKPLYHYNHRADSYMGSLTTEKKASDIVRAVSLIEDFLCERNETALLDSLLVCKVHLKRRILFKGVHSVQKKYLGLWPESASAISSFPTTFFHRAVLRLSLTYPSVAEAMLFMYSVCWGCRKRQGWDFRKNQNSEVMRKCRL